MKMGKMGIRAKFFLQLGAILAVCLIGISVVNSQLLEKVYIWNVERSLRSMAQETEQNIDDYFTLLSDFEREQGVSIDLYDAQDNYLYEGSGYFVSGNKLNIISRKEHNDGSYFNVVSAEGSTTQYILYGKTFENGYHIEITAQKDPIKENASIATKVTTSITVLALALALIFVFDYSRRFTKPLIQMNEVMENIANLDFSTRTNIVRKDEIGTLANNINTVSDSLDSALTELREKNAKLQEDIERERRIEKMRQEFVSSASHELKTPIAIIRGYAEGLKMNAEGENPAISEYCDIIMRESDKMNELVLNMLEQSLYSSGTKMPEEACFNTSEYVSEFIKSTTPIFEEKGVNVQCDVADFEVLADKKQMTTVLSNIVLNACSHATDEKIIKISAQKIHNCVKINVFNTGSKIEEKDAENIFTSFYRADKAHSRKEGRFGLGLSIVKSIVDNHGCECGFENKENGVEFWFTMKCAPENSETEGQ